MNGGPSGFNNAPVTRAFLVACGLFTFFFGIKGRSDKLGLSFQDVFGKLQIWKFFVSIFAFSSTPELMFGLYLLYYFRVFERQIGSNKYSVFILFSVIISLLFEVVSLAFFRDPTMNILTSGPYGLIFASFIPFFLDIPVSKRFPVFGITFSDKSFVYMAGLQLIFSAWRRSLLPGVCGILAGALYRLNVFHIRKLKFPESISSLFSRIFSPSLGSPRAVSTRRLHGNLPTQTAQQVAGNHASPIGSAVEPPEDAIAMLVSMGFDPNSARQALVHSRNDINAATNILLEAQSH